MTAAAALLALDGVNDAPNPLTIRREFNASFCGSAVTPITQREKRF